MEKAADILVNAPMEHPATESPDSAIAHQDSWAKTARVNAHQASGGPIV